MKRYKIEVTKKISTNIKGQRVNFIISDDFKMSFGLYENGEFTFYDEITERCRDYVLENAEIIHV